ncbi:GNAT family N-acetyltransferase [Streptomyces sp. NBC_01498]|uniref:GNAT family N-acetyltransferase n=1 Tax=Streptomyces sp. NBC_01498 TaxID=2975870 RepID=UPI002E7BA8B4|nr:GNAT family N-acetyltransferase [Streptomyces sp. NBC_01498]WTL26118.1 GNAT family N-acetyltransferase [Streptomyces sp. NBC_01498]
MALDVRAISDSDLPDWLRALNTGFLRPPSAGEDEIANRRVQVAGHRVLGAFDEGRCVATYRSFPQELTAVGGAPLPANAISNVTVSPTHRRRGLLSRMIRADLAEAKERGDIVSTLIAAEYPIYGRYGFGPATWLTDWAIDVPRAGLDPRRSGQPDDADGGRVDLVDAGDVRKLGPDLHDRMRARRHGVITRDERWWQLLTGVVSVPAAPWTEPFHVVYRSASGEVEGLMTYRADDRWGDGKQPLNTVTVVDAIAVTTAAERALWRYVCSIDWITTVRTGYRAPDDLLPHYLPDPRAARVVTHADFLWVRILDTVRALESRTYANSGTLVLDVRDPASLAAGRYRLDTDASGSSCAPTTETPDLTLDVRELGALYLGDESAVRLSALGSLTENTAGAASRADALFRTSRRPWCPETF